MRAPGPTSVGHSATIARSTARRRGGRYARVVCKTACGISNVWVCNLECEFQTIRKMVQKYKYIAMDTEFPGVVAQPVGEFRSATEYHYQTLRCNVDVLKVIQLGLTFFDEDGNTPPNCSTWQFNFKFSLAEDTYAQDSIDLLTHSGIQFSKHNSEGIDPYEFAQLLTTSGMVLSDEITWLAFHSCYDFAYMMKLLTGDNLPACDVEFFELLEIYFPAIYDLKYLMKDCRNLRGGLQRLAEQLQVERVGRQHQAGSDSLLTGMAFFKMREVYFQGYIDQAKYCGHLFGLTKPEIVHPQPDEEAQNNVPVSFSVASSVSQQDCSLACRRTMPHPLANTVPGVAHPTSVLASRWTAPLPFANSAPTASRPTSNWATRRTVPRPFAYSGPRAAHPASSFPPGRNVPPPFLDNSLGASNHAFSSTSGRSVALPIADTGPRATHPAFSLASGRTGPLPFADTGPGAPNPAFGLASGRSVSNSGSNAAHPASSMTSGRTVPMPFADAGLAPLQGTAFGMQTWNA
ncbi:uncharacterized protein [Dermacentor andersoni]|uniref:uncharacterized protein n=1 Tax=Dermacentor andersoni TaxID=34620 RepID=UPI002155D335|nr:uncharacterized protein LOC126547798 [Dermacentor andersoni]